MGPVWGVYNGGIHPPLEAARGAQKAPLLTPLGGVLYPLCTPYIPPIYPQYTPGGRYSGAVISLCAARALPGCPPCGCRRGSLRSPSVLPTVAQSAARPRPMRAYGAPHTRRPPPPLRGPRRTARCRRYGYQSIVLKTTAGTFQALCRLFSIVGTVLLRDSQNERLQRKFTSAPASFLSAPA